MGGTLLLLFEEFILIFTFLLINIPVFLSLYRYALKGLNPFARLAAGIFYWILAFLTNELAPFIGVLILIFTVHRKEPDEIQIREIDIWSIGFRDIAYVSFSAVAFKLVISQVNIIYVNLLERYFGLQATPQEIVEEFATGESFYKILLFALVVIMAPLVEEYVFRYFLYDRLLLPRMPAIIAAIISSALFTLLHLNVSGIPTFFGLGLYCTFMYEKKGFYGAVITHIVSNLITMVLL